MIHLPISLEHQTLNSPGLQSLRLEATGLFQQRQARQYRLQTILCFREFPKAVWRPEPS